MRRITKIQWVGVLIILVIGVVVAGCKDSHNPITPTVDVDPINVTGLENEDAALPLSYQKSIGNYTFKIYTEKSIDAAWLLDGIGANDDAETIQSKLEAKRMALYPEEEIMVEVDSAGATKQQEGRANIAGYVGLAKAIYWWNNYNPYNYYWSWTISCNSATLYFRIIQGSYELYRYSDGSWRYYGTRSAGTTIALAISGYNNLKGFKGLGRSTSNRADIVMYFFR